MKIFHYAILVVQLSPIFVLGNGEAVPEYKCTQEETVDVIVKTASAKLTKGCAMRNKEMKFELKYMYEDAKKNPKPTSVGIDISEAAFTDSYIKLINADGITGDITTQIPLLFTMMNSKMSGTSKVEFGHKGAIFKLPPHSLLRIVHSKLTISTTATQHQIFIFHSLQLVSESSIEISSNLIKIECKSVVNKDYRMYVFYLPENTAMKISDKSSFTLRDNNITMHVDGSGANTLYQYVWYQDRTSPLTISQSSVYTWLSNIISVDGYNIEENLEQYIWFQYKSSPLTISGSSKYTWASNAIRILGREAELLSQYLWFLENASPLTISQSIYTWVSNNVSIVGCDVEEVLEQYVWFQEASSPQTITKGSKYIWLMNSISMDVYDVDNVEDNVEEMLQYVWFAMSQITISALSQFLFDTNKILLLAKDYQAIESYVMRLEGISSAISGSSSMVWKDNCMCMAHNEADKRHVFGGKWDITDKSEMQWTRNYITTTDKYKQSDGNKVLTELVWGPPGDIGEVDITINSGILTIGNTVVIINGATHSILWSSTSSLFTSETNWKPVMDWSVTPAKDNSGTTIPTLDYSNLRQYNRCPIPITPTCTKTTTPSDSLSQTPTESHTISQSLKASPTPSPTGSLTPSPTGSLTPSPTGSLTPSPTGSLTPSSTGRQSQLL